LILVNPLCAVAYLLASWKFFQARIMDEEFALLYFFGDSYRAYQKAVPSGIPYVRGFMYDHPALRRYD
jgi:protein-S-isoprenylcysteine O-methyltransferase